MNCFDLLRLMAAALVILHHTRPLTGRGPFLLGWLDLGAVGVGVFFVVSGYLVTASWGRSATLRDYLVKRLLRIAPGLVVSLALTAFVLGPIVSTLPVAAYFARPTAWLYVLRNALLYPVTYELPGVFTRNPFPDAVNGSLWTLRLEFTCYLGVAALGLAGLLRRAPVLILAALAFAAFVVLAVLRPELAAGGALRLVLLAAQYGFLFLAGALLQLVGRPLPAWSLASAVFLATPLWPLGLPAAVVWIGQRRGPRLPADLSYGLYIYAFPLQQVLAAAGRLDFLTSLVVTVPFAAASWFLVERPALRLKPRPAVPLEAHLATAG